MFSIHGLRSLPFWTAPDANSDNRIAYNDPYLKSVVDSLEANYDDIKAEYLEAVMGLSTSSTGLNDSKPMESDYVSTDTEHHLHKGNWEWHSYILKGGKSPSFAQRCPKTASIIDSFGDKLFGTPFSYCFFSTLHADSSIEAHCAAMNLRLRIHLPLIVPVEDVATNKCGIKVASQKRKWEEGKCIVLDDSYQHEVWNETSEARVVLLVDIWHPDVTKDERNSINEMFDYSAKMGWLKNSE
ncbi:hypothetical protein TrLO_g1110 [Triparma laevis f. longispina]|uniref:Aspartyl/asparaginy/proline hydroxylase domain-containing protein n=1 Tax=Triparma laevis f. longispina TaxID=1714387 RepID=A0A9W7F4M8_9STRA|nr:hypothetical protein TrLO_g1110 [Triparma laevis f. longispina]